MGTENCMQVGSLCTISMCNQVTIPRIYTELGTPPALALLVSSYSEEGE